MNRNGLLKTNSLLRKHAHHGWRVRHGDVARGLRAAAVEVLVRRVQRDHQEAARRPLERGLLALAQPHTRRAAAGDDVHHFFVHVALGLRLPAGPDLHQVRVVRQHPVRDVDDRALTALALPVAELDVVQVLELVLDDALDALPRDPLEIRVARLPHIHLVGDFCLPQVNDCHLSLLSAVSLWMRLTLPRQSTRGSPCPGRRGIGGAVRCTVYFARMPQAPL